MNSTQDPQQVLIQLWLNEQTSNYKTSEPEYKLGLSADTISDFTSEYLYPLYPPTDLEIDNCKNDYNVISQYQCRVRDEYVQLDNTTHDLICQQVKQLLINKDN